MKPKTMRVVVVMACATALAACGPAEQNQPVGQPTPADLQTPVPAEPGFPADPVLPTPRGTIATPPPAPVPTALPTP